MLAICIIAMVFRVKGFINGSDMVDLLKDTTLGFFGANGVEHIVNCIKDGNATKLAMSQGGDIVPTDDQEADDAKTEAGSQ